MFLVLRDYLSIFPQLGMLIGLENFALHRMPAVLGITLPWDKIFNVGGVRAFLTA